MAIMEISVVPIGTKTPSLSRHVAQVTKIVEKSGLKNKLCPMGTVVEGELRALLSLAEEMHNSVFSNEVARVVTSIKIDERRDKEASMEQKIDSVKKGMK